MYPILLPLLAFVLIFYLLWHRHPGIDPRTAFLSSAVTWGVATVVITEFLTLLRALTRETLVICWVIVTVAAALIAVRHTSLPQTLPRWRARPPSLVTLTISVPIVAILIATGFICILGWPNQWDTMVYHLSRVDHWVQNNSVAFYPTHIVRQLFNPPWTEYTMLHLTLLGGDERFANLPQWFSMFGSLLGVSLIAKRLGAAPLGQLFSALFCATIPMGILQASGTQNDYVTAFWLVCVTDALLDLQSQPASTAGALKVGASVGLALFTKGTAYIFVGPLLLALWLAVRASRPVNVLRQGAMIVLLVLALNTPHYLRNLDTFGTPLGPRNLGSATEVDDDLANETFSLPILISNLVRNLALHAGTPLPAINSAVRTRIERWHTWLGIDVNDPRSTRLYPEHRFAIVGTPTNPDRTGNPIHLFLIALATIVTVASGKLRRNGALWSYVGALFMAFVLFSFLLKWQPWHSRLHLPLFVLWSPVLALVYDLCPKMLLALGMLLTVGAWPPLVHNYLHPLLGNRSVLRTDRIAQYFPFRPMVQAEYVGAAEFLRSRNCADVGLVLGWDDFEHPLWVLLPEVRAGRGRLEHVRVDNSSARLQGRYRSFTPCAVVAVGKPLGETLDLGGQLYRLTWSSGRMRLFLPEVVPQR